MDVTLSFVRPGQVAEVAVKEGDEVKAGQLLARQDDLAEQVSLAQLKAEADDTVKIRAAEAQLDQKKVTLLRTQEAFKGHAATELEVKQAELDVTIADLSLELSKFQHEQDRRKYEEARLQVERMRMLSPLDGRVEKVAIEKGESVEINQQQKTIRVVRIDPLWIDVPVDVDKAARLKAGDAATAWYHLGNAYTSSAGKVLLVAKVADPASDTLQVRVELPNPAGQPAGMHVQVDFPSAAKVEKPGVSTRPTLSNP